ncbi:carbon-nitrogen hydrolase family protein [Alteromonas sp. 5E99-2]|uniref:carbon-nitrogen hydrolase family protein n=1 Tax=Alteromonas sp. 5E99-2 TaxID=2817683 RepID=UPI001A98DA40|nr:carbon-nitrogen hydrolase family protein [Alteromonas sp. 5E99-2]MBO1255909.1 carbon-nitrogen hydrolase family protein [Alteromonas sp. 5E99-2]
MSKRILAALQIGSDSAGTAATLDKILSFEQQIKDSNCDLIVLPEALLGGYPKGSDFGTRLGYRTDQGREDYLEYWQQAVDIDGPEIQALKELAARNSTAMVVGVIERAEGKGATLYCTAVFIGADGTYLGKHRKLMPTALERLIWAQGDGSTLPVINTPVGNIGAAICWENYMPLLRTTLYAKGIDIWCAPTVDDRPIWQSSMSHIAYEARSFLVSACQYQGYPENHSQRDSQWPQGKPLIRGGTVIMNPMGEVLAGPIYEKEGVISATVDMQDIIKARYDMDATGHYARPDVFSLQVDETERAPYSPFIKTSASNT